MSESSGASSSPENAPTFAVVAVPEQLCEQVLAYVKELEDDENATSGYMLRSPLAGMPITRITQWSGTGCSEWDTNGLKDMGCGDSDT